jgi:hypothetical protein
MNTATAAAVGTSLEVLAPYLPYGIALQTPLQPARTLSGLHGGDEPSASCKTADGWESSIGLEYIKPVLRDFSQLTVPLPTGEVPAAIEFVRSFVTDQHGMDWSAAHIDKVYEDGDIMVSIPDRHPHRYDHYYILHSDWSGLPLEAYAWLVKNHFAVGLKPEQYIPLSAPSTPTREADNTATTIL